MRIVIIGNGIVAMSMAYGLLKSENRIEKITVVGRKSREGAATLAAAAMLNSFAEIEHDTLDDKVNRDRFYISRKATSLWPAFEHELKKDIEADPPTHCSLCVKGGDGCFGNGTYVINNSNTDELDDKNFNAIRKALLEFDKDFQDVDPSSIEGYRPHQKSRAIRALKITNEGWYNPGVFLGKLQAVLEKSDICEFVDENVEKLVSRNNQLTGVVLKNNVQIEGDKYILAAGAASQDIIENSSLKDLMQRIFYGVGMTIELKSNTKNTQQNCIRTPNRGLACGTYSAPKFYHPKLATNRIVIGASNFISPTKYYHGRVTSAFTLLGAAQSEINRDYYKADFVGVNIGWRPTSTDTFPMIGWSSIDNLFVVTGTKRDGFHLAPYIRSEVTKLFFKEKTDNELLQFAPCRGLINNISREKAIEKAVEHKLSAEYQHGFEPAFNNSVELLKEKIKDEIERIHDEVDAFDWGIHPEMLDMYKYGHAKNTK